MILIETPLKLNRAGRTANFVVLRPLSWDLNCAQVRSYLRLPVDPDEIRSAGPTVAIDAEPGLSASKRSMTAQMLMGPSHWYRNDNDTPAESFRNDVRSLTVPVEGPEYDPHPPLYISATLTTDPLIGVGVGAMGVRVGGTGVGVSAMGVGVGVGV